jgi:hypothetical protein
MAGRKYPTGRDENLYRRPVGGAEQASKLPKDVIDQLAMFGLIEGRGGAFLR